MSNAKERLKQFVENQKLTVNKFCTKNSFSNSFFNNKSAIGSDKLETVNKNFPELNIDWVVTGRGEMIYKQPENVSEWKEKYYRLLEMKITVVEPETNDAKKTNDVDAVGGEHELSIAAEPDIEITKTKK
jgi:hypothetical protein